MNAHQLVNALLEAAPRACAACQKEFGVKPEPGTSHGICKRHAIIYWSDLMSPEEARARIEAKYAKDPAGFCPDLSQS